MSEIIAYLDQMSAEAWLAWMILIFLLVPLALMQTFSRHDPDVD